MSAAGWRAPQDAEPEEELGSETATRPGATVWRIDCLAATSTLIDGPFTETKEFVAG